MFEFVALVGHWLHIATCALGYITFAAAGIIRFYVLNTPSVL
jgi:hypothetical protein